MCAEDVAIEALSAEIGEITAVVDMRVTEHGDINGLGVEGKLAVTLNRFLALALIHAAFQENELLVHLEQKH